ncbi:deoxyribose-phosphate aldolase [Entomoplasma freundtii]|uniref:Deoxyribose-phosphate aldolase n=1 Tax=Entomoplasma freundtii TaxID=74700 RepID=A0A2K8NUR2_9MOLU|nr:deoxyribose-phosphate aldolase [Entomoplasma freundtii]ATZ16501.1 deoxyribose-phosphate aldolase [Entomoplasma freundtii]TDY56030.1 deoxyribose-phosphate aldolase [Entomoplasma freundtii]
MELNKYIDQTLLKPEATAQEITKLCDEAKHYHFATVCVNPSRIALAKKLLAGSDVEITTVIGFPLGAQTTATKVCETKDAIAEGADEIDMVMNIGALKDRDYDYVLNDFKAVRKAAKGKILKVILEVCLLTDKEIVKACELALEAGLDFVKTSTGFNKGGATPESVALMKSVVQDKAKVKAAGGVRNREDALVMIEKGASRLGTSGGVAIMEGKDHSKGY